MIKFPRKPGASKRYRHTGIANKATQDILDKGTIHQFAGRVYRAVPSERLVCDTKGGKLNVRYAGFTVVRVL